MSDLHKAVLVNEVLAVFKDVKVRFFFDGTLGAGGHAKAILQAHPEIEQYIGCDKDPDALEIAKKELASWKEKVKFIHGSHADINQWLKKQSVPCVQGVLIDAGVSSMQLDRKERGFSFQGSGPLDMRMDPTAEVSAEEVINRWKEEDLVRILRDYGEEPRARAIARAIVAERKKKPIRSTSDLVEVIRPVARGKKHLHPATLVFQAIRIAVNDELGELERGIQQGIQALCPMGRIAIISFHRLEDRIAKNCLRNLAFRELKKGGSVGCVRIITKKPIEPQPQEVWQNPRCRSAKLRAAEKVE